MRSKLLMTDRQIFNANQGGFFMPELLASVVVYCEDLFSIAT